MGVTPRAARCRDVDSSMDPRWGAAGPVALRLAPLAQRSDAKPGVCPHPDAPPAKERKRVLVRVISRQLRLFFSVH